VIPVVSPVATYLRGYASLLNSPRRASPWRLFAFPGALLSIGNFTLRTWGKAQTIRYLTELEARSQTLADNPALGRSCDYNRPGFFLTLFHSCRNKSCICHTGPTQSVSGFG
jgi:hypothetical protein